MIKLLVTSTILLASAPFGVNAQTTPLPADQMAASQCLNVHNEIFPNHNSHTPQFYPYNYPDGQNNDNGTPHNNQFFDVTLPAVKAAAVRCLRVGAAAPGGDGLGHVTEFNLRMKTENMLGFKLDTVTGYTQPGIDNHFAATGPWAQAEGQNEADKYEGCATIVADQQLLWNAIRSDTNPAISSLPVVGPSFTTTNAKYWLSLGCKIFVGIANFGNWHPYNHATNPEAPGWLYAYYRQSVQLFPGMPSWATEYGLRTCQPGELPGEHVPPCAPNSVITTYLPRVAATMLNLANGPGSGPMPSNPTGFERTYWHQVADGEQCICGNAGYGVFFDYNGNPKPQGAAMGNLIKLFSDPSPPYPLAPLKYTVTYKSGNAAVPQTMLFQRSNGKYMLMFWIGQPIWDQTKYLPIAVPTETVTIQLGTSVPSAEIVTFNPDGTTSTRMRTLVGGSLDVTVTSGMRVLVF